MTKNDGGPAFPCKVVTGKRVVYSEEERGNVFESTFADVPGMTLRAYAAIKLRVPESGIDWLDAMIQQSRLDEFAGKALAGLTSACDSKGVWQAAFPESSGEAYKIADAMLAERERGK